MAGVPGGPTTNQPGRKNSFTGPPGWPKDKSAHVCPTCQRGFSRSEHLERHMATHLPSADSKVFICSHCTKGFSRKDVLIRHVRAVHETPKTEVKRSRRRSCQRCAGFKIKCTGGTSRPFGVVGACEACKKRKVECIFDVDPTQQEQNNLAPGKRWAEKSKSRRFSDAVLEPPASIAERMARGEPALKRRRTIDDPQTVIIGGGPSRLDHNGVEREDVSHHLISAALMFQNENGMPSGSVDGLLRAASFSQPSMMAPPDYQNDNRLQPMVLDPRLAEDCGDRVPNTVNPPLDTSPTGTRVMAPDGYEQGQMYIPEREMTTVYGQAPQMGSEESYQNGLLSVPEEDYSQMQMRAMDEEVGPLDTSHGVGPIPQAGPSMGGDWRGPGAPEMPPENVQDQTHIGVSMAERGISGLEINPVDNWYLDPSAFDMGWWRENGEEMPGGRMGPFDQPGHPQGLRAFQRSNNNTPGLPGTPTPLQTPDLKTFMSGAQDSGYRRGVRADSPRSETSGNDGGNDTGPSYRPSTPGESNGIDGMGNPEDRGWSIKWPQSQDQKIKLPPLRQVLLEEYSSPRGGNPSSRRSSYGKISYSSDPTAASLSAGMGGRSNNPNDQGRREMSALRS